MAFDRPKLADERFAILTKKRQEPQKIEALDISSQQIASCCTKYQRRGSNPHSRYGNRFLNPLLSIGKLDDYYRDAQRSRPSASRSAARATQGSSHDETGRTWQ